MGYSKYKTLKQVVDKFGIRVRRKPLITELSPIEASDWLKASMEYASMTALSNEKVKSERIISPVLTEVHRLHKTQLSFFSGEELNVKPEDDLNGPCDFFFSAIPDAYLLEAPIVSLTEAKDEDLDYGIAQCTAQMIAAQIFNEQNNTPVAAIWGCSTTAIEWKFIKLENNTLYIDETSYSTVKLEELLGAFQMIFEEIFSI